MSYEELNSRRKSIEYLQFTPILYQIFSAFLQQIQITIYKRSVDGKFEYRFRKIFTYYKF